jgi:hypothetical protein
MLRASWRRLATTFSTSIHAPLQHRIVFGVQWRNATKGVVAELKRLCNGVANFNGSGMVGCAGE